MRDPFLRLLFSTVVVAGVVGCTGGAYPGPDKQGAGMVSGAVTGAGVGAVTAAQVSAVTGPGALIGAGFGAVAGGVKGAMLDRVEEQQLRLKAESRREREVARAHRILNEHYERRLELHPMRDIYPADLFFSEDKSHLKRDAYALVSEIGKLNKERFPWSRLAIITYIKTREKDSDYALELANNRSKVLGDHFTRLGFNPRRLITKGVLVDAPVLVDPEDKAERYSQAIEIKPLDR